MVRAVEYSRERRGNIIQPKEAYKWAKHSDTNKAPSFCTGRDVSDDS